MKILMIGDDPGVATKETDEIVRAGVDEIVTGGPFDQIYLTGALECVPREYVVDRLNGWAFLLADLGELHVRVPSLEWATKEIAVSDSPKALAYRWIYGTPERIHRSGFTLLWLRLALLNAGYNVRQATQLVVQVGEQKALENYALAIWQENHADA